MIQNYAQITMETWFLAKNKIRTPHVHHNQIDGDQFPQPEGAELQQLDLITYSMQQSLS
jgi:hypothetical protein